MNSREEEQFINWQSLLLNYYKSLFLSEEEVMVLLLIDLCIKRGNIFITPDILILKMTYTIENLEKIYVALSSRGYVNNVLIDNKIQTSLDGIKNALISQFLLDNNKKSTQKINNDSIYSLFENEFGRALTPFEIDIIREWNEQGYTLEIIKWALGEAIKAKTKSLRYVDKILLNNRKQLEISAEGNTTISDKWRQNIDETIEIAKSRWIDE